MGEDVKGEFFLIAAIVIVVTLILLRELFVAYYAVQLAEQHTAKELAGSLERLAKEYELLVEVVCKPSLLCQNVNLYFQDFSSKVKESVDLLYVLVVYNSSAEQAEFILGNYLWRNLRLRITLTNGTTTLSTNYLLDQGETREFALGPIAGETNLTIHYSYIETERKELVELNLTRDLAALYLDLEKSVGDDFLRRKYFYQKLLS